MSGEVQGLLVQRGGHDGLDLRPPGQLGGKHRVVSRLAGAGVDRPRRCRQGLVRSATQTGNHVGRRLRLVGRGHLDHAQAGLPQGHGAAQDLGMADHQRPTALVDHGFRPRAGDDFRSHAGRIPQRNGDARFLLHAFNFSGLRRDTLARKAQRGRIAADSLANASRLVPCIAALPFLDGDLLAAGNCSTLFLLWTVAKRRVGRVEQAPPRRTCGMWWGSLHSTHPTACLHLPLTTDHRPLVTHASLRPTCEPCPGDGPARRPPKFAASIGPGLLVSWGWPRRTARPQRGGWP